MLVGIWSRKGLGIGLIIGVFVGFVGKPTPMSGVSEDLSTVLEEDMMIVEKLSEKLQNDAGEILRVLAEQSAGMQ